MRVATIASLGASAVLGVGALFVAKVWLPNAQSGPGKAAAAASLQPAIKLTSVVAAAKAVPFGQKLEAKNLTLIQLPAGAVPEGAYSTIEQVIALDGGAPVALAPLVAREPILPTKISGGAPKPSMSATIGQGMRAYTVRVNDVAGGGGHVLPGDRVDVLLTQEVSGAPGVEGGSRNKVYVSSLVVQNVRVLGMDLVADPASTEKFPPKTATLEVNVMDAGKLAVAGEAGVLSLALRRVGATEVTDTRDITMGNDRWAGVRPPSAPALRGPPPARPAAPRGGGLVITQGGQRTVVDVPTERSGG